MQTFVLILLKTFKKVDFYKFWCYNSVANNGRKGGLMAKFEKNLAEGNVVKQLILFSLPVLLSNIIQSLYSTVDMLIVGQYAG